ncbi:ABC transporter substrate-binding protein [Rhodospirillum sp. A1_3_36]|uniref:ABC transporter substrate-binding protein n=1 Tax=Rhodospirillum sp. A1_3_36 TaxID=3391666 RepID=UPI0039A5255C
MTKPLRVLCTEILPWRLLQARAQVDLGFPIEFHEHDFVTTQRIAATQPETYDVYDQCFHNLDIVWHWGAIQAIETDRITTWNEVTDLTKKGGLDGRRLGCGDAPVTRLYVQPDGGLSSQTTGRISMLPTVHNFDSFALNLDATGKDVDNEVTSWSELLDPRWKGRVALVDEPAIGVFDLAMALRAAGKVRFRDLGNLTLSEIDQVIDAGWDLVQSGHLAPFWTTTLEATDRLLSGELIVASLWSPSVVAVKARDMRIRQAVPVEGYRAWHGGLCLANHLTGERLDMAYAWMNWFLSGWPGAVMARQGYYLSVPGRVRAHLDPEEWDYWYEGLPAARPLPNPSGALAIRLGEVRSGGSYRARSSHVAVWNTTMDEHNYLVRRWNDLMAFSASRGTRQRRAVQPG